MFGEGIELINIERGRQITEEHYTPEHDEEHIDQEIQRAAVAYIAACDYYQGDTAKDFWPWEEKYFKPSDDPVRNLVKAGALIAAEIDRLLYLKKTL